MSLHTVRRYATLPTLPKHGPMPPMVSVIIPLARTNLVTNPSFETNTTGWTDATGDGIGRAVGAQYHGTYSLLTDGTYYGPITLTADTVYAASIKILAVSPGRHFKISVNTTGGVELQSYTFVATGRWQWIWLIYHEIAGAARRFYITAVDAGTADQNAFYIDGAQVESCADGILLPTTYIDGDQPGLLVGQQPPAYLWNGTPHASTSSRSALTRAGGYLVNLEDAYNFLLTGIIGLGMAAPNNVSIPYTVLDGARYLRTTKPPRTLSLPGRFQADNIFDLDQNLSAMRAAFDRDLVPIQQPMVLHVEPRDECNNVIGDFAQIQCLYAGGLEGNDSNVPLQDAAPTFTMYVPFLIGGNGGQNLIVQQDVANANAIIQRSPDGQWTAMDSGMSGGTPAVVTAVYGLDGILYAGGDFTNAGTSGADYLAKWNGSTWSVVKSATSINGPVNALAVGPDGRIYIGGYFTNADGIAAADYIVVYDPAANTYAALGTGGASAGVNGLAFDTAGNLYATGSFSGMGGVANTAGLAKWNGSAWSSIGGSLGGGVSATGNAIVGDSQGNVYLTGDFTSIGGTTITRIGKWNGTTWSQLLTGLNNIGYALAVGSDGSVYAGGQFTTAGGVTVNRVARWNGTGWFPLGSGFDNTCYDLTFGSDGSLWAAGDLTTANGILLIDHAARWNGSTWLPLDVDVPGTRISAIATSISNMVTVGYNTTGTATSAANTTVTNVTPSLVYPKLTINGPSSGTSRIYQLVNYTTGIGVWLNLTLSTGEVATLDFNPQAPSFTTTFQGDITNKILPGSQPSLFYLAPGDNTISFFAASSTVVALLSWPKHYNGMADLVNSKDLQRVQ